MRKIPLFTGLVCACFVAGCAEHSPNYFADAMDKNAAPQQDFYQFVNGKWQAQAQIPADRTSWGTLAELNEQNEQRSLALLTELINAPELQANPHAARLRALYQSYTDLAARNQLGLAPLQADLAKIDRIDSMKALEEYLIAETKAGGGALFGWSVFADLKNSRQNSVYLSNEDLGLDNDYFQKNSAENTQTLAQYEAYVAKMLGFLGDQTASQHASAIVAFEKAIANTLFTNEQARDMQIHYEPVSIQQLKTFSKNLDLARFLTETGVNVEKVILWEKGFFTHFDSLFNAQNLPVIKNYLRYRLISDASEYLDETRDEAHFDFYARQLRGQKQPRPMPIRALNLVNDQIGQEFARFYVEKFFPAQAKQDVQAMSERLLKAYSARIEALPWMSAETKAKAQAKLAKFRVEIGYPNKWRDYSSLTLRAPSEGGNLYDNMKALGAWRYRFALSKIGKPVDLDEWGMLPQVVNASYSPLLNRIVFPAGILQAPLYRQNGDPAENFGAIGAIIGHEITHGFDDSGSKFDGDGNLNEWWSADDRRQFEALANRLVTEFDGYEVAPNIHVNGKFTLGENIADLGGLSIAFDAFNAYQAEMGEQPVIDNLTAEQRFFMSWTRAWRVKATQEALIHQVKSDPHAPGRFRAVSPVMNIDGFHRVFHTQSGDKMYKSPADQIKIW